MTAYICPMTSMLRFPRLDTDSPRPAAATGIYGSEGDV